MKLGQVFQSLSSLLRGNSRQSRDWKLGHENDLRFIKPKEQKKNLIKNLSHLKLLTSDVVFQLLFPG